MCVYVCVACVYAHILYVHMCVLRFTILGVDSVVCVCMCADVYVYVIYVYTQLYLYVCVCELFLTILGDNSVVCDYTMMCECIYKLTH